MVTAELLVWGFKLTFKVEVSQVEFLLLQQFLCSLHLHRCEHQRVDCGIQTDSAICIFAHLLQHEEVGTLLSPSCSCSPPPTAALGSHFPRFSGSRKHLSPQLLFRELKPFALGHLSQRNENVRSCTNLYANIPNSFTHNSKKLGTTQMLFKGWVVTQV